MCFSASASFTASAIIGVTGVLTLKACSNNNEKYLGSIPLLFAVQQFFEGLIWLGLDNPFFEQLRPLAILGFLVFAWIVWPVLVPLSVLQIETDQKKKRILKFFLKLSLVYGFFSALRLFTGDVTAEPESFHITYRLTAKNGFFEIPYLWESTYFFITVIPLFISTLKKMSILAVANLISLLISFVFFNKSLPSVWCFFAAILSSIIYLIIKSNHKGVNPING